MIDWVSPPWGDAAARSNRVVRVALAGQRRLTGAGRELAAVVPHRVHVAAVVSSLPGGGAFGLGHQGNGRGCQAAVSASSPSSARMWQACRTILRASGKAARLPLVRSFTWA